MVCSTVPFQELIEPTTKSSETRKGFKVKDRTVKMRHGWDHPDAYKEPPRKRKYRPANVAGQGEMHVILAKYIHTNLGICVNIRSMLQ